VSDAPSVPAPACAHVETCVGLERTGSRLNPTVALVERCMCCAHEIDRKKLTRGQQGPDRRDGK
jgi:hypothetical protein